MIQYIIWKQVNVTGKMTLLYLSMSEAVMPNIRLTSFMSHSGFGGGAGGGGRGAGHGGKSGAGGASSSYLPIGRPMPYFGPPGGHRLMVFSREPPLQCILGSWTLKCTVCRKENKWSRMIETKNVCLLRKTNHKGTIKCDWSKKLQSMVWIV